MATSLKSLLWKLSELFVMKKVEIIYIPLEINKNVTRFFYTYFSVFISGSSYVAVQTAELLHGFIDVTLKV